MSAPVVRNDESPRSFSAFIAEIERGALNDDLSTELQQLVAALRDHAAAFGMKAVKGSLTLTLNLTLDRGLIELTPVVKVKTPDEKRNRAIYWPTDGDNLSPQNPNQLALPGLRTVGAEPEMRSA